MINVNRLDLPYIPSQPESDLDKKFRLYAEADSLYEMLVRNIEASGMDDLTKSICLLNIKTQWLERALNDFYDRIAITSSQTNPFVTMDKISNTTAHKFRKKGGEMKGFAELTLGNKHTALDLFHYTDTGEEIAYRAYLSELDQFIKTRNEIIHNLFSQNTPTKTKVKKINEELTRADALINGADDRDSFLAQYLFNNMATYWDMRLAVDKKS